jgi:hypothetical protein
VSSGIQFDLDTVSGQAFSFMQACARAITLCAETGPEQEMAGAFSIAVDGAKPVSFQPNPLPVLRNLEHVKDMKLARDFREFAQYLPWKFSPRMLDQGEDVAIFDFRTMFDMGNVLAGLMYVDAGQVYPEHNHPPRELYFLVSGTAHWRFGGNHDYRAVTAGNILLNFPWNWHGLKAGHTPLLALYLQTP